MALSASETTLRQGVVPLSPDQPAADGNVTCAMGPRGIFGRLRKGGRPVWPHIPGYEILDEIGSGGMGIVLKARHRQLGRLVALKMLSPEMHADPHAHQRFQVEAEAIARLQHPNIIQVFDVGYYPDPRGDAQDAQTYPYIALELVDGGSLAGLTGTPQSPAHAARLVEKIARAAHAAHQVGVLHRDLKPSNVLLSRAGEPKIADFGLAKEIEPARDARGRYHTEPGLAVGTPEYMAPEQVDGKPATPAIDIYALGVILYELLTARVPFKGASITETMLLVKYQEPVPPRRLQPKLPRDLETICLKCLAKAESKRYESAEALADDLVRWSAARPIQARPISRAERLGRWAKRNPTVAALSAAVLALAVFGIAGITWKWLEADQNAQSALFAAEQASERSRAERWERYRANIAAASSALQLNNVDSTRQTLEAAPLELRNWEWRHLRQQLDATWRVLRCPGPEIQEARYLARGDRVVTFQSNTIRVWDLLEQRELPGIANPEQLRSCMVGPDGRQFAYVKGDRNVVLRSLSDGREQVMCDGHEQPVTHVLLEGSPPRLLAAAADHSFRVWNAETGRLLSVYRGHRQSLGIVEISPDGRLVASYEGTTNALRLWHAETGADIALLGGMEKPPDSVSFSPSGEWLVALESYPSCALRLWDTQSGKFHATLRGHRNQVLGAAWTHDGRILATCALDQTVRLWDCALGKPLAVLRGHSGAVNRVAFSPDGLRLASAGSDQTVRLWDVQAGAELAVLRGHAGVVVAVAFARDGSFLSTVARDGTLRLWDAHAAEQHGVLHGHTSFVYDVAYHPDGRHIASASWDGSARVWDARTGQVVARLEHDAKAYVTAVAFHPGGRLLASVGRDNKLCLWSFPGGECLHRWEVPASDWRDGRLAFNPNGELLACGTRDGPVRLFSVPERREVAVLNGHKDIIRCLAFSPDGKWLASGADCGDRTIRIWDVANRSLARVLEGHSDRVYALAFSRDGRQLATGSTDTTVRIWETADWGCTAILRHGVNVYSVAFSKDGSRLACGCADNTIRLWDPAAGQEVAELRGHTDYVHAIAFSPDGTQLLSGSGDMTVRLWDTLPIWGRRGGE